MRRSGGWIAIVALGVVAAGLFAILVPGDNSGSDSSAPSAQSAATRSPGEGTGRPEREDAGDGGGAVRAAIGRVLRRAVAGAARAGDGVVEAAVMLDGWSAPVAAASEPGAAQRQMRMWSIAKVVTAVALLRELGWESSASRREPSSQVTEAMRDALIRSENCRQRRMVLGLQSLTGGPGGAQSVLRDVLREAGADADLDVDVEPPESLCEEYLSTQQGSISDPFAPTLLLGTATWRIADMARFLHALGSGAYGKPIRDRLLPLMRARKGASREVPREDFSADLDWGAGNALGKFTPAYKAGWGGTLQGAFMAAQGAVIELDDGRAMVFAVAFHPRVQPPKDDPGLTEAPAAIEHVMGALGDELFESPRPAAKGDR